MATARGERVEKCLLNRTEEEEEEEEYGDDDAGINLQRRTRRGGRRQVPRGTGQLWA